MTANSKAKLKMLYIRQMLEEETDAEHGLSMAQIITRLAGLGVSAERKSVYRDIQLLRDFGMDIKTYQRNPVEYALARRDFTLPQLMLMADAVESCKFLTSRQSKMLIGNIKSLASTNQQEMLNRRIHVAGRVRSKTEGVFERIDAIHKAMRERRKISYRYVHSDANGNPQAESKDERRVATPVGVSFDDGFYYLAAWSDQHDAMRTYRVDRMEGLKILDDPAVRNAEIAQYKPGNDEYHRFGNFADRRMSVTLAVDPAHVEILRDRFGDDAQISEGPKGMQAAVKVCVSPQFFGWVAGLNGLVTIAAPQALVDEYKDYLQNLLAE